MKDKIKAMINRQLGDCNKTAFPASMLYTKLHTLETEKRDLLAGLIDAVFHKWGTDFDHAEHYICAGITNGLCAEDQADEWNRENIKLIETHLKMKWSAIVRELGEG